MRRAYLKDERGVKYWYILKLKIYRPYGVHEVYTYDGSYCSGSY